MEKILSYCKERSIQVVIGHINQLLLGQKSFMLNSKKKLQLADRYHLVTLKVRRYLPLAKTVNIARGINSEPDNQPIGDQGAGGPLH